MTIPAGYSKVRMTEFDAIVNVAGDVVGMVDADGTELWFSQTDSSRTFVAMGDSLTAYGMTVDTTTAREFSDRGYWCWLNVLLNQRLDFAGMVAEGGRTMDTHLARLSTVLALNPGWVLLCVGGVDVLSAISSSVTVPKVRQLIQAFLDRNIRVAISTVGPAESINTDSLKYNLQYLNDGIRYLAGVMPGIVLIDSFKYSVDGSNANGYPQSGITFDNTHRTSKGAYNWALAGVEALQYVIPARDILVTGRQDSISLGTYGNFAVNGLMSGTGGSNSGTGASGSVADGWTHAVSGTITSVASKVAVAVSVDGYGPWQQLAITGGGAGATAALFQAAATIPAVGSTVFGAAQVDLSGVTAITGLNMQIDCRNVSNASLATAVSNRENDGALVAFAGVLRTPDLVIPAGTTQIWITITITCAGSSAATLKARRVTCRAKLLA